MYKRIYCTNCHIHGVIKIYPDLFLENSNISVVYIKYTLLSYQKNLLFSSTRATFFRFLGNSFYKF